MLAAKIAAAWVCVLLRLQHLNHRTLPKHHQFNNSKSHSSLRILMGIAKKGWHKKGFGFFNCCAVVHFTGTYWSRLSLCSLKRVMHEIANRMQLASHHNTVPGTSFARPNAWSLHDCSTAIVEKSCRDLFHCLRLSPLVAFRDPQLKLESHREAQQLLSDRLHSSTRIRNILNSLTQETEQFHTNNEYIK